MKINKCVVTGILLLMLASVIYFTDALTPFIRSITYWMLMGSSKGKDVIFFTLSGILLILSQMKLNVKKDRYLKLTIIIGLIALITGIILELIMRVELGIRWNTIFVGMKPNMCSTSVIHSHIYKTIFGNFFHSTVPEIKGITEASSLYPYIPQISNIFIIYFPILLILETLAIQKRNLGSTLILSMVLPCLLIGILDGGLFATPSYYGIFGCLIVYRNSYYIDNIYFTKIFKYKNKYPTKKPEYKKYSKNRIKFTIKRMLPYILIIFMIIIRLTIMLAESDPTGYELIISNPTDNITVNETFSTVKVINETHYILNPNYKEMNLLIDLKYNLTHKCDYYTLSWNGFSYFR